jgi:hypothetical protein
MDHILFATCSGHEHTQTKKQTNIYMHKNITPYKEKHNKNMRYEINENYGHARKRNANSKL